MILSLRRESIQRAAGDLPYGPRTPQTAKEENGPVLTESKITAVFPFGIPFAALSPPVGEGLDPPFSNSPSAPAGAYICRPQSDPPTALS